MNKRRTCKIITIPFIVTIVVTLIALIIGQFEPFGKNNILSTYDNGSCITNFYDTYDMVHDHNITIIGNTTGIYHDNLSNMAYYFSDPTNWILLLFPRKALPTVFNFLYIIKLGLASASFAFFLLYINLLNDSTESINVKEENKYRFEIMRDFTPKGRVSAFIFDNALIWSLSIAYSLSASFLIVGMNISYTSAMAVFPLVIVGLLEIINTGKISHFVCFYSISFYLNLHITFISTIFIILFFFSRSYKNYRAFIRSLLSLIRGLVLSYLFASPIILNAMHSPVVLSNYNTEFPVFNMNNPLDYIKQLLPNSSPSVLSLYLNNVDIYFCFIAVLCCFMYVLSKGYSISERLRDVALFIIILLSTSINTFKHLFNGLHDTDAILYSYLIAFMGLYITYKVLTNIKSLSFARVSIAAALSAVLIISCMLFSTMYDSPNIFIYSLEFLFIYYLVISMTVTRSLNKYLFSILISLVIIIETCLVLPNECKKLGGSMYSKSLSHTLTYEYYDISRLIKKEHPDSSVYIYDNEQNNYDISIISLMGYDYIITTSPVEAAPMLEAIDLENEYPFIFIYKNNYSIHSGYLPADIANIRYDSSSPFLSFNDISRQLIERDTYSITDPVIDYETAYDNEYVNFTITPQASGYMYFKGYFVNYLGYVDEGSPTTVTQLVPAPSYNSYYYQVYKFDDNAYIEAYNKMISETANINVKTANKYYMTFKDSGYLKLDYPYDSSISYYINSQGVVPQRFYGDLSIIPVNKGRNTIQVKYNPIFIVFSIINVLIAISSVVLCSKDGKNEKTNQE